MLQITKARNSLQAFSAFPAGVPTRPQNSIILEAGAHSDDTGEFQAHYTVRRMSRVQLQRTQKTH